MPREMAMGKWSLKWLSSSTDHDQRGYKWGETKVKSKHEGLVGLRLFTKVEESRLMTRRPLSVKREKSASPKLQDELLPQATLWQLKSPAMRIDLKEDMKATRL